MCCGNLRTGTMMIGIIEIILSTVHVHFFNIGLWDIISICEQLRYTVCSNYMKYIVGCLIFYIVANAVLIYGAFKRSRYFLLPWIIFAVFLKVPLSYLCINFMLPAEQWMLTGFLWYLWIIVVGCYTEFHLDRNVSRTRETNKVEDILVTGTP